jgi:hypothetical protein
MPFLGKTRSAVAFHLTPVEKWKTSSGVLALVAVLQTLCCNSAVEWAVCGTISSSGVLALVAVLQTLCCNSAVEWAVCGTISSSGVLALVAVLQTLCCNSAVEWAVCGTTSILPYLPLSLSLCVCPSVTLENLEQWPSTWGTRTPRLLEHISHQSKRNTGTA